MKTLVTGSLQLTFIGAGVSKKNKPYVRLSNGEETKFFEPVDNVENYSTIERGDLVDVNVERDVFSDFGMKCSLQT